MRIFMVLVLGMMISSCIPAAIGPYAYSSSKNKKAKQEFMSNFNNRNAQREKDGLKPLDICTEQDHFDKDWADDDPNCKKRIDAYEAGDLEALGQPASDSNNICIGVCFGDSGCYGDCICVMKPTEVEGFCWNPNRHSDTQYSHPELVSESNISFCQK